VGEADRTEGRVQQQLVVDSPQLWRGLRRFIVFDQLTCAVAVAVMLGVYLIVHRSPYLVVLAAVVCGAGLMMGLGVTPARRGRLGAAVTWVAVSNWSVAVVATAVASFCLPVTVVAAVLPVVLAVPYVSTARLRAIGVVSLAVATITVLAGTMQDVTGFSSELPGWLRGVVLVVFVPFVLGLVVVISSHNHRRLSRALDDALAVNGRLRASEAELRGSRARLMAAAERERRLIGRDLHDGAQQRLVALRIGLAKARLVASQRPADATALLARLEDDLESAISELRHLARGLHPPLLADLGLCAALTDAAERLGRRCRTEFGELGRYPPEVEATVYFCCTEAMQNVVKHAGAGATVLLRVGATIGGGISFEVTDDGAGFELPLVAGGRGLTNIADRVGAVGGELVVRSTPDVGTSVRATLPSPEHGPAAPNARGAPRAHTHARTPLDSSRDLVVSRLVIH
jgi:signal transduction histidine kinase